MTLSVLGWRRSVAAAYQTARRAADPAAGWQQWRLARDDLFANHPATPLSAAARARFAGLPFAPYDPALRFTVAVEPAESAHLDVPTATDGVVPFDRIGQAVLSDLGTLDVWWLGSYGGGIFVPVKDGSAASTTYGGGRYLIDTVKGADLGGNGDRLVLDLNFSYNPSCAYDPDWACPLAPPGNTLEASLTAGELMPEGGWP